MSAGGFATWVAAINVDAPQLASWSGGAIDLGLAAGVILTMAGLLLQLQVAHERMSAEEAVKDGRLTEAQAIWRVRLFALGAPVFTVLGAMMLVNGMIRHLG